MLWSEQVSQQAIGQEAGGWNWLGVGQQEQPIRRETGDPEPAHSITAGNAQSVSSSQVYTRMSFSSALF